VVQYTDEANMLETYALLQGRFPILEIVVKNLSCSEADKRMLRELCLALYGVGYEDGAASVHGGR
jgi:hypothetical protein